MHVSILLPERFSFRLAPSAPAFHRDSPEFSPLPVLSDNIIELFNTCPLYCPFRHLSTVFFRIY